MNEDYLYSNEKADEQAYDEIMSILRELDSQPENEGYGIMVGGHSLGGAMASVLALELAGTEFKRFQTPVQCVSFSSPLVGCREFRAAYQVRRDTSSIYFEKALFRLCNQNSFSL